MERFCKNSLRSFKPYEPADGTGFLKLNANECPYDLSPVTKQRIADAVIEEDFTRYCDSAATRLRDALGHYVGFPREQIVVGNGSSEIIQMLMSAFLEPGEKLVAITPTFTMYMVIAKVANVISEEIPVREGFLIDVEQIIAAAREPNVKMVFLCTPNNPTGNAIPRCDVERIINETDCLVVIDEAYGEFAEDSFLSSVKDCERVIVLRTLSKAFGLAGLRVGYGIAHPFIIREINKVRLPYNLNAISQKIATLVLEETDYLQEKVRLIKSERERLYAELNKISGVKAFPSEANFLLFQTEKPAADVNNGLMEEKILVRDFSKDPLLPNCLRVTVGRPEDNDRFLQAMQKVMRG